MPACPIHFDQERHERLGDRIGGPEPDDLATVRAPLGLYLHAAEENGPIQTVLHEDIARRDLNLEALQLLSGSVQVDGGIERSIQRRQKMYVSETERERC